MRIVIDTTPVFCPQVSCTIPLKGMLRTLNISHYVVIKGTNSTISSRSLHGRMHPSHQKIDLCLIYPGCLTYRPTYIFCLYRPVAAGHFRPSSSGGLGALPLGALRLGALSLETFFSSDFIFRFERRCFLLCGQVEKSSLLVICSSILLSTVFYIAKK